MASRKLGDHLSADPGIMSRVKTSLIQLITDDWLWQGFQENEQCFSHRVVAARDCLRNAGIQTINDLLELFLHSRGLEQVLLVTGIFE